MGQAYRFAGFAAKGPPASSLANDNPDTHLGFDHRIYLARRQAGVMTRRMQWRTEAV